MGGWNTRAQKLPTNSFLIFLPTLKPANIPKHCFLKIYHSPTNNKAPGTQATKSAISGVYSLLMGEGMSSDFHFSWFLKERVLVPWIGVQI